MFIRLLTSFRLLTAAATLLLGGTILVVTASDTHAAIGIEQPGFFAFGGVGFSGSTSLGEKKFDEVFTANAPIARFKEWYARGGNVGKAYALVGFHYLDPERYERLKSELEDTHMVIPIMDGCLVDTIVLEQLFKRIDRGDYDSVVKNLLTREEQAEQFQQPSIDFFALGPVYESATTSPGENKLREILATDNPRPALDQWYHSGLPADRAYCLVAYYYLAPERYQELKPELEVIDTRFMQWQGPDSEPVTYSDVFAQIESGKFAPILLPLMEKTKPAAPSESTHPANGGDKKQLFPAASEDDSSTTDSVITSHPHTHDYATQPFNPESTH